jgi:hypothetical protein
MRLLLHCLQRANDMRLFMAGGLMVHEFPEGGLHACCLQPLPGWCTVPSRPSTSASWQRLPSSAGRAWRGFWLPCTTAQPGFASDRHANCVGSMKRWASCHIKQRALLPNEAKGFLPHEAKGFLPCPSTPLPSRGRLPAVRAALAHGIAERLALRSCGRAQLPFSAALQSPWRRPWRTA